MIPKYAAAPPISIPNVDSAQYNIQAGQETVQYVSNIYKYYVAYKLTLEQAESSK